MKFITAPTELVIQLEGLEKLWALKSQLVVPITELTEATYTADVPDVQNFRGYFRAPGTAWPWRFLAGTYWGRGGREFWYVHLRQPGMLTLGLNDAGGPLKYNHIRVSCTPEVAQAVIGWSRR